MLIRDRTNALLVQLRPMPQVAQASHAAPIPTSPLSPLTSSKSLLSSIAIWTSTMACLMDLLASRPHLAAPAELLSRTRNAVAPRTFLLFTQASPVAKAPALLEFTALDSTAARPQAPSTTLLPPRLL